MGSLICFWELLLPFESLNTTLTVLHTIIKESLALLRFAPAWGFSSLIPTWFQWLCLRRSLLLLCQAQNWLAPGKLFPLVGKLVQDSLKREQFCWACIGWPSDAWPLVLRAIISPVWPMWRCLGSTFLCMVSFVLHFLVLRADIWSMTGLFLFRLSSAKFISCRGFLTFTWHPGSLWLFSKCSRYCRTAFSSQYYLWAEMLDVATHRYLHIFNIQLWCINDYACMLHEIIYLPVLYPLGLQIIHLK